MTFIVGLTGGIGCGKSSASRLFSELGIDVIDTDVIARQ
ncbi:MAG: dephospho-CoA kinase, partial [Betaproteobacteria bacterium]|nr:dephospho-CoA kinase [Betaproteobacteria bacterium]